MNRKCALCILLAFVVGMVTCLIGTLMFFPLSVAPASYENRQSGVPIHLTKQIAQPKSVACHVSVAEQYQHLMKLVDTDEFLIEVSRLRNESALSPIDEFQLVAFSADIVRTHGKRKDVELRLREELDSLYSHARIWLLSQKLQSDYAVAELLDADASASTKACINAMNLYRSDAVYSSDNPIVLQDSEDLMRQYQWLAVRALRTGTTEELQDLHVDRSTFELVCREFPEKLDGVIVDDVGSAWQWTALSYLKSAANRSDLPDGIREHLVAVQEWIKSNLEQQSREIRQACRVDPRFRVVPEKADE